MKKYQADFYDSLLNEVKDSLYDQKFTQSEVGSTLGLKQSAVSSLLSGRSRMNLDQFFALSDLVGTLPQTLIQRAGSKVKKTEFMSDEMENCLYQSETHLLCYCAAIKPVKSSAFKVVGVAKEEVSKAFKDLCAAGFLIERSPGVYTQKDPRLTWKSSTRLKGSRTHQKICVRSWQYFDHKFEDGAFLSNKFNLCDIDLYTDSQIKELDAALFKVYERMLAIKQANLSSGYSNSEKMSLWNIHLMMMTPVQVDYED